MDNKKLRNWTLVGILVIFMLAALWHFVYRWYPNGISAVIFPVNESPWEHVKLFFIPAILFYVLQYSFVGKKYSNFIFSHGVVLVIMPALTLALFYFYRNTLGIAESLMIDIVISFFCITVGSLLAYKLTLCKKEFGNWRYVSLIIVLVLFASYSILTFYPPHKPIFYDHNIEAYGLDEGTGDDDHDH